MTDDELVDLERAFWKADASFYRERLAPRCVMVFPGVGLMDRSTAIGGLEGGPGWQSISMSDAVVTRPSPGTAVVSYTAKPSREGQDGPYRAYASSLYVRTAGDWKLAFHQQTMVG